MPSVSSLLRSAQARAEKVQNQQDALVAYEYQLSPKTYQNFVDYTKYLQGRIKTTSDPSKALSYTKDINSAQSSYISNEIQRQTIGVLEGTSSSRDKYAKMVNLYYQAANSGNYDLAQSLHQQLDSLSVTIQNEAQAGAALASKLASMRVDNVEQAADQIKSDIKQLGDIFSSVGDSEFSKQMGQYAKELGLKPGAGFFDQVIQLAKAGEQIYQAAMASESDPQALRTLQGKYTQFTKGDAFSLPGANGKPLNVSFQDLKDQADANRVGEEIFKPVTTGNGVVFTRNQQTGYVQGRTETGEYKLIPLYNPVSPASGIKKGTDANGNDQFFGVEELLKKNGFQVAGGNSFFNTGNIKGFYGSPFPSGSYTQVYVGPNGELQLTNGQDVYTMQFDDKGTYTGLNKEVPSAITQVNGAPNDQGVFPGSARFNSRFLATQDLSRFSPDIASLVGIVDPQLAEAYRTKIANFNLVNGTRLPTNPSSFLQANFNATSLQNDVRAASRIQAAPSRAIQPATPRLQGSTVNPFNLPPVPHLSVARPTPTPRITIAKPPVNPTIRVGAPTPTGTLRVL